MKASVLFSLAMLAVSSAQAEGGDPRFCVGNFTGSDLSWRFSAGSFERQGAIQGSLQWECLDSTEAGRAAHLDATGPRGQSCGLDLRFQKSRVEGWVEVRSDVATGRLVCTFRDDAGRKLHAFSPAKPTASGIAAAKAIPPLPPRVPAFIARFGGESPVNEPIEIHSIADFDADFPVKLNNRWLRSEIKSYFDNGGDTAYVVAQGKELRGALAALTEVDDVGVLVLPQLTELEGPTLDDTLLDALSFAEKIGAFVILDPPPTKVASTPDALIAWRSRLNLPPEFARRAAIYFPRLVVGPQNVEGNVIGPGGALAAIYARTDRAHGVWTAPAGTTDGLLNDTYELTYKLDDAENGRMNAQGLNALRWFNGFGPTVWGTRTLAGADALADPLMFVNVSRLASYIELSLRQGLSWVAFEKNDEQLWSTISKSVGDFMNGLYARGALAGPTPAMAYQVKCDATTTTPQDVLNGKVNLLVLYAPVSPAEFISLPLSFSLGTH